MNIDFEIRLVEWIDSTSASGWQALKIHREQEVDYCVSIGFLISDTDEHVTLIQSFTNRKEAADDIGNNAITIPKVAITKISSLAL